MVVTAGVAAACAAIAVTAFGSTGNVRRPSSIAADIHLIKHVIVIMQENRSFDSYFGTFPGADGIPPDVCVPDPAHGGCVKPYPDTHDRALGGPHGQLPARRDISNG